jgi:hypothetical protein
VLFNLVFALILAYPVFAQYATAEFEFDFTTAITKGQLVDSTRILGDSIWYNFKARYGGGLESGFWKIYLYQGAGNKAYMDSGMGTLIATSLTTGQGILEIQDPAEWDSLTSAYLLSEDKTYYLYATLTSVTPPDSVIGVSSAGITVRHQPFVDSTTITPTAADNDTTLNSGSYIYPPDQTVLEIFFYPRDLDDDDIQVKIYFNTSPSLTKSNLTLSGTYGNYSIDSLDGSYLIATKTLNDTMFFFEMANFFPNIIPKGVYYVYVAANDKKHANLFRSRTKVNIKHSPKINLDKPAIVSGFDADTIDSRDQKYITIGWTGGGFTGDIDVDDNAHIAVFLDTAASYHGNLSLGGVADSFFVPGTTSINLTNGFTISENGDWGNDMWVFDISNMSYNNRNRTSNSYWKFFALITDGVDTTVSGSSDTVFFRHSPHFKFLQDFGGAEELAKSSGLYSSPLGSDQTVVKKGDVLRINFESFDLDSVAQQYIRLVASTVDTTVSTLKFSDFKYSQDPNPILNAWLINSRDGSARQDSCYSTLSTNNSYYDWYTGKMNGIVNGDYYIYAFVSTRGNNDSLGWALSDSVDAFKANGTVKMEGADNALSPPNVRIVPNVVSVTKGDTVTLDIKANTLGNPIQGVFISLDIPDSLFGIVDQNLSASGVQPYILLTDYLLGADTLGGTGNVALNPSTKNWEFNLQKFNVVTQSSPRDSTVAQIKIYSKGTTTPGAEETKIYFSMESQRKTRFTNGFNDIAILPYSPALTSKTKPMARITGNVPLQGRSSNFSKEITFELRKLGSLAPISNSTFEALNDKNPSKPGIQITTNVDGGYELKGVPVGKYNVVAKTTNYLSAQYFNVDVVAGDYLTAINPTRDSLHVLPNVNERDYKELRAGDVSSYDSTGYGDNWIDGSDINFIKRYFTYDTSTTGYKDVGDVSGNGTIDLPDLLLASGNYNTHGTYPTFHKVEGRDNSNAKMELLGIPEIVYKGDEFNTNVRIENVSDLRGYQFTVKYDPNKYEIVSSEGETVEGEFLISGNPNNNKTVFFTVDDRKGKIYVGCLLGSVKTAEGSGDIVNLRFRSKVDGDTPDIQLTNILIGNSNSEVIRLEDVANVPNEFKLSQNYPNPFNPETNIRFQLPEASKVTLTIYNILGQEVRSLISKNLNAGYHTIKWDGTNNFGLKVASGVYLYRLNAGSFVASKKMVFLK